MESRTLQNGLTVLVLPNHSTPLLTIEFNVKNGSYTEPPEFNGLSHLYEHMFFKANAKLPSQERYMARVRELGAEFNGTTSTERVNYYITLHSSLLREGLEFMTAAIRTPLFDAGELERERVVVNAEYDRLESMPSFHLQRAMGQMLWGQSYCRKNPIGDRDVISTCPREKLETIQGRYYRPNNTALLLSGDVEADEAFRLAEEFLADWPRGGDPFEEFPVPPMPPLTQQDAAIVLQPVQTVSARLSWHGPSLLHDREATYAADLLSYIVNQSSAQFHKRLVDSGLCVGVDLGYFSQNHVGPLSVHVETSAEKLDAALDAVWTELHRLTEPGNITDEEIANAKSRLEVRQFFEQEDPLSFSNTMGFWWATAGVDYHETYIEKMRTIGREDMVRVVKSYLLGRPCVAGVLASPEDAERHGLTKSWLLQKIRKPRLTSQRKTRPEPELFEIDGLEVLHKYVPDTEVVAVQLYFQGGTRNYGPGQAGIERMLLDTARRGGRDHDRSQIEAFQSRTGTALRVLSARDYSRLSLYGARAHAPAGLDILLDVATRPTLEPAELELTRSRLLTEARHKLADPQSLLGRHSIDQFYRNLPYAVDPDGTVESISALQPEALRRHHALLLERSRMLCVAVGNLERGVLEETLRRRLEGVPRGHWKRQPLPLPVGATEAQIDIVARQQPTNYVLALFHGPNTAADDYPAFYAAADYLSHRIFEEVRTKRNLAYAASSSVSSLAANHGRIVIISVDPKQSFEVVAQELQRLRTTEIEPKLLADTLLQLRTGLLMQRTRLSGQADELGRAHVVGESWRLAETFAERIAEVTPAQVRTVFEKYYRNFNFVLVGDPAAVPREFFLSWGKPV